MALGLRQRRRDAGAARADNGTAADGTTANGAAANGTTADGAETRRVGRGRVAAARGTSAAGGLLLLIARVIRIIVTCVVVIIVAGIVLYVLGANMSNTIVKDIHDAAQWLVGPFKNVFSIKNAKLSLAVNWGLGALVWLVVGGLIASLFARAGRRTADAVTV